MRNENNTHMWTYKWLGENTLKERFGRVFMNSEKKNASIRDMGT